MKPEQIKMNRILPISGLGILVFLSFFAGIGSGPLFDVDEGAFSEATREMFVSSNYLTTYLNGALRFDKPILIYWLQLLSVRSFGVNEFAFRFPSALAATLWTATLFLFVRRERSEQEAWSTSALLILSLQVSIIAKAAIADALLNLCLATSFTAIFSYWRTRKRSSVYIAFCAMGFGMLDKGPVAIIIPAVVSFLFFLWEQDMKAWFKAALNPVAIALLLVIALPWYLLEYREQGQAFIDGFFMKHNVGRFHGSMEGHSGSLFYYVPVLLIGLMPSSGLLLAVFAHIRERLADPLYRFCILWFGFVFLFFTLSGTKLPHYMIYGYTPLFLIFGAELLKSRNPWMHALWPTALLLLLAALPLILEKAVLPTIENLFIRAQIEGFLNQMAIGRFSVLMVLAAILCMLIQTIPMITPSLRFIIGGALLTLSVNLIVLPMAARVMQQPVKEAALLARKEGLKVVMWKVFYPSFLVYSGSFVERRKPEPGDIVLTSVDRLSDLGRIERLYDKHGIILARMPDQQKP
jgi:4-amino-4-deoxy-L-arabinose transferase-like glycosyltransferase